MEGDQSLDESCRAISGRGGAAIYDASATPMGKTRARDWPREASPAAPALRQPSKSRTLRTVCFASLVALTLVIFWTPLSVVFRFSFQHEHYSHIILVPLITAAFLSVERRGMTPQLKAHWLIGLSVLILGVVLYASRQHVFAAASQNDQLSITMFAVVIVWIGIFILCYGHGAFRRALFPLLFLFLMVPIPNFLLDRFTAFLLAGSAEVTSGLLELTNVPFVRSGFVFSFPGFAIEIAQECSGIRSSLALLITSLLAGHLLLRSFWTKAVLVTATIPILIIKNGIRITTLTLLSMYVDPRFLTGSLHQQGGFVFFLIALMLLLPIIRLLRTFEARPPIAVVPVQK